MLFQRLCFLLLFLVFSSQLDALTLAEALKLSFAHLAMRTADLEVSKTHVGLKDIGKHPRDGLAVEIENFSGRMKGFSESEVTLAWKRPLLNGRQTKVKRDFAELAIAAAGLEKERLRWEISANVQASFHKALSMFQLLENAREVASISGAFLAIAKARVEAGAGPGREILKAELEFNRAALDVKRLEGKAAEAITSLTREIGVENLPETNLVGTLIVDIDLPEISKLQANISTFHPSVRAVDLQLHDATLKQKQLKVDTRPTYDIEAGIRNFRSDDSHAFIFGIETTLPNRKAFVGAVEASAIEKDRLLIEKERVIREIFQLLDEEVKKFFASRQTARDLNLKIIPASAKVLDMALEGYRLGKTDQLVVLEARKAHAEVLRELLFAVSDLYEAVDSIEKLSGICLVGEHH